MCLDLVCELGWGEFVRVEHKSFRGPASGRGGAVVEVAQAEFMCRVVSLLVIGVDDPFGYPLPEDPGVVIVEQRHRDNQRLRVMPAQREGRLDHQFAPARQVLEVAGGYRHPFAQNVADVLGVVKHSLGEAALQFLGKGVVLPAPKAPLIQMIK